MKFSGKIAVLVCAAAFASACAGADDFSVTGVEWPSVYKLSSLHTKATVGNDSGRDLVVETATVSVAYKGRRLAAGRLILPIEAPARSENRVRVDMKIEEGSFVDLQTLAGRIVTNPSQITVTVDARVRYGRMRRNIKIEDIPFSQIITNFGHLTIPATK